MTAAVQAIAPDAHASSLENRIRDRARQLGFDPVGITSLGAAQTHQRFVEWLAAGHAGEMAYLERGAEKRRDFRLPFEGVRSAIVVGQDYGGRQPAGPVARYARGDDYHDVMVAGLDELHRWIEGELGSPVRGKAYVDTGPILERELAQRAGLGWIGKNTMLINPRQGSFFFLGALLLDLDLEPDAPFEADHCGTCTRCIDACPTDAIVAPRVLDARQCISYLTIERRSDFDSAARAQIGDQVYGCDICQDVCPWNIRFARDLPPGSPFEERAILKNRDARDLSAGILEMDAEWFSSAFRGSPMKRARLQGLKRNASAVIANTSLQRGDTGDGG